MSQPCGWKFVPEIMFTGRSASALMHPDHVLEELVFAKLLRLMRPAMALWRSSMGHEVENSTAAKLYSVDLVASPEVKDTGTVLIDAQRKRVERFPLTNVRSSYLFAL